MEKSFNKIYEEVYKKENEELNNLRKQNNIKIAILIVLLFALVYSYVFLHSNNIILLVVIIIAILVIIAMHLKDSAKYKVKFKINVISKMVSSYSSRLIYNPMAGVSKNEYNQSRLGGGYDRFYVEDGVSGSIGKSSTLKMSQVTTEIKEEYTDSKGNKSTQYVTTFKGLYGMVKLEKSAFTDIDILNNANFAQSSLKKVMKMFDGSKKPLHILQKDKVEIDSAEFEKYYDFYATDKIMALRIVTSELIEKFIKIKAKGKYGLEIRIVGEMLYFRYSCGDIFEPITFRNALDFNTLYKYFNILDVPVSLIEAIIEHINSVEY